MSREKFKDWKFKTVKNPINLGRCLIELCWNDRTSYYEKKIRDLERTSNRYLRELDVASENLYKLENQLKDAKKNEVD